MPVQSSRAYARRDKRLKKPKPFAVVDRDIDILYALYTYRFLTTDQIASLFFSSLKRTYTRLHKLYHHRLIDRRFLGMHFTKMNTPMVYVLDKAGAELLRSRRGVDIHWHRRIKSKPLTTLFLHHTLETNEVRIAIEKACQQQGIELLKWVSEYDLKTDYDRVTIEGDITPRAIIPDGYCVLKTKRGMTHLFWEVDRGTESSKVFKRKIFAYLAYAKSDLALKRFGTRQFRVLTVAKTTKRVENLRAATQRAKGKSRFWFTTLSEITPDTVLTHPIWQVAGRGERTALLY